MSIADSPSIGKLDSRELEWLEGLRVLGVATTNNSNMTICSLRLQLRPFILHSQVMMMRLRQEAWKPSSKKQFIFLSSDSSLQAGSDYQMTLEDSVLREHAAMVS